MGRVAEGGNRPGRSRDFSAREHSTGRAGTVGSPDVVGAQPTVSPNVGAAGRWRCRGGLRLALGPPQGPTSLPASPQRPWASPPPLPVVAHRHLGAFAPQPAKGSGAWLSGLVHHRPPAPPAGLGTGAGPSPGRPCPAQRPRALVGPQSRDLVAVFPSAQLTVGDAPAPSSPAPCSLSPANQAAPHRPPGCRGAGVPRAGRGRCERKIGRPRGF